MPDESPLRSLHIEAEYPDPPQIRRPEPEPPDLLRKSVVAGAVAGIVSGATASLGCGGVFGGSGEAYFIATVLAAAIGLATWIGFVIFRRRLFARRVRRRPSRY